MFLTSLLCATFRMYFW